MIRTTVLLLCSFAVLASCKKEREQGVPLTGVNIQINVNLPEYNDLTAPGGWAYVTGGSQGLIVYRKNIDEFVALDRHCPYQPENLCRVNVDESDILARDSACCHSAFLLLDGSIAQGPAAANLRQYNTSFNGTTLRIYN